MTTLCSLLSIFVEQDIFRLIKGQKVNLWKQLEQRTLHRQVIFPVTITKVKPAERKAE